MFARPGEKLQQLARAVPEAASRGSAEASQGVSTGIRVAKSGIEAAGQGVTVAGEAIAGAGRVASGAVVESARHAADPEWLAEGARRAAADLRALPKPQPLWRASVVALVAASAVDAHSSWGKLEANPVVAGRDGRFGARSLGMKVGLTSAVVVVQHWLIKKNPGAARGLSIANLGLTAAHAAIAVHNYGNQRPAD